MNKPSLVHIMNGLALIKQQAIISTNDDLVYWQIFASLGLSDLIHWDQDKMAAISHMTFSNSLSWMKIFVHLFWFKFHWRLILRIQLTISHQFSLLQIMAWRRAGDKPLLKQWLFTLLMHIWVTHQPEKSKSVSELLNLTVWRKLKPVRKTQNNLLFSLMQVG